MNREARARFVESHLDRSLAYQIRSLREGAELTQAQFAEAVGMKHPNNVSSRLENPHYGKHTLTTLKKIAAACDVALVVWFVPFSRLVDWATGTPYVDLGLRPSFYNIPRFDSDVLPTPASEKVINPARLARIEAKIAEEDALVMQLGMEGGNEAAGQSGYENNVMEFSRKPAASVSLEGVDQFSMQQEVRANG